MHIGYCGRCGSARIDDDDLRPILLGLVEVWEQRRLAFRYVGAGQHDAAGKRNIGQPERQPLSIPKVLLPAEAAADMQKRPL